MRTKNLPVRIISLLLFTFLILNTHLLSAQGNEQTTVTLKSGEKVTGKVVEAVPDQYIKIELTDGSVKKILSADIVGMQTEQSSNKTKKKVKVEPSAIGGVAVGYDLGSGKGYVSVEPKVIGGFKAGIFRMGAGLSFIYAARTAKLDSANNVAYGKSLMFLPVFANFHFDFGKKKIKPSLDISGGYPVALGKAVNTSSHEHSETPGIDNYGNPYTNVNDYTNNTTYTNKGLGYFNLGIGVTYAICKKVSLNAALQYQLLAYSNQASSISTYSYTYWFENSSGGSYDYYSYPYGPDIVKQTRLTHSLGLAITVIY